MNTDRRTFLKTAAQLGVSASIIDAVAPRSVASAPAPSTADAMGVLVDLTKCNGCRQCEAACREAAGFDPPTPEELLDESVFAQRRHPSPQSYTTVNKFRGRGDAAQAAPVYVKSNCLHCLQPACVSACLVGAMRKQPNGAVTYDAHKCMGCRYCMVACPFQIPTYEYDQVLTPQVRKCTFCSDEGNPCKGDIPACVRACPRQCLIYGRRDELLSRARSRIKRHPHRYIEHIYGEHEAGGTSWLFLSNTPFGEIGFLPVASEAPPQLSETIQHGVFKHFVPPVAWVAALGIAMWMSRPQADREAETAAPAYDADGFAPDESTDMDQPGRGSIA